MVGNFLFVIKREFILMKVFKGQKTCHSDRKFKRKFLENPEQHFHICGWTKGHQQWNIMANSLC
jgi:hypothetical protein